MDTPGTPVTRGALERVLARAAELQAASGDTAGSDALTEAQLIELGEEVGLSADHLRQALAEERTRGEGEAAPAGLMDQLVGVTRVAGQRVVRGSPEAILGSLDVWMQNEQWLRVIRRRSDRMVYEPRRDFLGRLRRAFGSSTLSLHDATDIAASVARVDAERSVVAVSADLRGARGTALVSVSAVSGIGALASGALAILGFITPVAVAPVIVLTVVSIWGARAAYARRLERTQRAVDQVLDRVEQRGVEPPQPPSLLRMIGSALPRPR